MSVEPQALERSVLEAKERDELATIAGALGLKPGSRTSKAGLVDQILQGIGVEEPKPKRARTTRKKDDGGADNGSVGEVAAPEAVAPSAVEGPTAGAEPAEPAAPSTSPSTGEARTGEARTGEARTGEAAASEARTGEAAASEAPREAPREAPALEGRPVAAEPSPQADGGAQGQPRVPREQGGGPREGQREQRDHGGGQGPREQRDHGGGQGQREQRDHGQSQQQQRNQQHQQQQQRGQQAESEPGNRRSRRRRGRERERDRGERDLRGQEGAENVPYTGEPIDVEGLLDLRDEGYGFLRTKGYLSNPNDVYVSLSQVRRFALRKGDYIKGAMRPASSNEKYPALLRIDTVSAMSSDEARERPKFEDLTPLFPDAKLRLEVPGEPHNMVARIVDLVSPIGKGQRGLIVSPPKAGKTTVMKQVARSIETNNPEVHLMVLLVDERPEEVTDMKRWLQKGEVVASTFDRPSEEHTQVAELAIERAKRLVELGQDVVIILDGITRLARAYNLAAPASGRILSGGVDSAALYPPKKFFGSARNIEEGGSLTILATALVETGSRMDEVIFEEFKGTGNMELRLDRKLAERRVYPAIDVNASSTRHEELLFERKQLELVWRLRRVLNGLAEGGSTAAGLELLMDKIKTTKSNDEFLSEIAKAPATVV